MLPRNHEKGRRHGTRDNMQTTKMIVIVVACFLFIYFVCVQSFFPSKSATSGNTMQLEEVAVTTSLPVTPALTREWVRKAGRRYVWIDVEIDGASIGRVTAEVK